MRNNTFYRLIDIRTIRIKIHDDIVRSLSNVWHVEDLWKNLIFLSTLDLHDFKYSSEDRVLKISKDALIKADCFINA